MTDNLPQLVQRLDDNIMDVEVWLQTLPGQQAGTPRLRDLRATAADIKAALDTLTRDLAECHELLVATVSGIDPDVHPLIVARITAVTEGCDLTGVCPSPVDPTPGSVDYWREIATRLGVEIADARRGEATAESTLTAAVREARAETWELRARLEWMSEQALSDLEIEELEERLAGANPTFMKSVLAAVWAVRDNRPELWADIKAAHAERAASRAADPTGEK